LNAFGAVNTPVGTDVSVPFDTTFFNPVTGQTEPLGVEVVFTEVLSAGETTVTASSGAGGDLPPNVAVQFESWGAAFFDVTTNASVAPPIRVCASYPDATNDGMVDGTGPAPGEPDTIPECQVRLHHKELVPPGTEEEFVDKTLALGDALCPVEAANACPGLCIDRTQNLVCGSVGELSTFGVFLQLVPEPVRLSIDVRPFSDANRINLRDPLPLPVAILGGETVDVTTIDATTLAFGPAGVAPKLPPGHPFDVNGDGHPDLVAVFAARDSGLQVGDTEACVSGEIEGLPFEGCDAVVVVNQIRCGLGGELALLLPPLWWLRARRRARRG
jgi:hypothetical protein